MILKKTNNFCWPTNFLQNEHRHSSWYIDSSVTNQSVVSKEINNKRENEEPQQSFSTLKKCRRFSLKKWNCFDFEFVCRIMRLPRRRNLRMWSRSKMVHKLTQGDRQKMSFFVVILFLVIFITLCPSEFKFKI